MKRIFLLLALLIFTACGSAETPLQPDEVAVEGESAESVVDDSSSVGEAMVEDDTAMADDAMTDDDGVLVADDGMSDDDAAMVSETTEDNPDAMTNEDALAPDDDGMDDDGAMVDEDATHDDDMMADDDAMTDDDAMADDAMADDAMMDDDAMADDAMADEDAMADDAMADDATADDDAMDDDVMADDDAMTDDAMMDDDAMVDTSNLPAYHHLPLTNAHTGETFTLADFAGKTLFVEPMATWCTNCLQQLGNVQAAKTQLGDDVVFIGLSLETTLAAENLASYADKHGFDFVWAVMSPDMLQALAGEFGQSITSAPSTPHFIIRPAGTVSTFETGFESTEELIEQIELAQNS